MTDKTGAHVTRNGTAALLTLGCKVNFYESEKLTGELIGAGFKIVGYDEYADIYIVNTCTVTNIADRKSRKMLHRAKRINPDAIVVCLGCFAQAKGDELLSDEGIDLVIGNDRKEEACGIIVRAYEEKTGAANRFIVRCDEQEHKTEYDKKTGTPSADPNERTRAYVKVQDGCNQFCTYCKIPYVRGKLKSYGTTDVAAHINDLADRGYKEIVLTGIHLSSYGVDLDENAHHFTELGGKPLLELISKVSGIEDIKRIRLGSLEPRIITEEFVKSLAGDKKLCPHFHLSLQSGCDATLKRMNRKYSSEEYFEACSILRKYFDRPAITTDIIVGFPGETDEDFAESLEFVRKVHFSDMHVFKYSKRDGTRAAVMDCQVPENVKNERSAVLIEAGKKLTAAYIKSFMDEKQACLFEEKVTIDGKEFWSGHNERYIKIVVPDGGTDLTNKLADVIPVSISGDNVMAARLKTLD